MELKIDYDWLDEKLKSIEHELQAAAETETALRKLIKKEIQAETVDTIIGYIDTARDEINDLRADLHLMKIKQQESKLT